MGADDLTGLTVAEVLRRWPGTAGVFRDFGMSCPGCPLADFYGLEDAAKMYGLDLLLLLDALRDKVDDEENRT